MIRKNIIIFAAGLIIGYLAGCFTILSLKSCDASKNIPVTNTTQLIKASSTKPILPKEIIPTAKSKKTLFENQPRPAKIVPQKKEDIPQPPAVTASEIKIVQKSTQTTQKTLTPFEKSLTPKERQLEKQIELVSQKITTPGTSPLQQKIETEKKAATNPFAALLLQPNYVMPFYYTTTPYDSIYKGQTPNNQAIKKQEFKAQISFQYPLKRNLFHYNIDLMAAYTQLFYWQFYSESQFFRETNYEPEIFIRHNFLKNWVLNTGITHESNGRGGALERSWNRIYMNLEFSGDHWYISMKPWLLIFKKESSDLHNKDIRRYLGNGRLLLAYKRHKAVVSLMLRNVIESGFKRKTEILTISYPIKDRFRLFVQLFNGYGQSLIEYNHKTTAAGIGISLNDWI